MRDYSFGNFLHELRKRRGLSQFQLGTLVGVSDKAVSKWENGSAKPQSHTLFKLADVLGVTVDELLACKYRSAKAENEKGVFAMKNKLWDNAYQKLYKRYGNNLPIEISNRYLSEATEFQQTDIIIYFDLLSKIRTVADNCNEIIRIEGGLGASFIAFVLGATEINPLKPHYFCPNCRKIEFDKTAHCGWDLPKKSCSCGCELLRDGHNLPFETVRPILHKNMHITISVSKKFYPEVKETISNYFKENTVVTLVRNERQNLKTIVIVTDNISDITNGQELSFNDYYERLRSFPSFTLIITEEFDSLRLMAQETNTSIKDLDFTCKEVLEQFKNGFSDKRSDYCKERFGEFPYETFNERIQIAGLSHCNDLWLDHAKTAIKNGKSVNDIFAYIEEYTTLANTLNQMIRSNSLIKGNAYSFKILQMHPLRILKAVMTMFCDINHNCFGDDSLRQFLLQKESQNFDANKYSVYMFLTSPNMSRLNGIMAQYNLKDGSTVLASEIIVYPMGFALYINKPENFKPIGLCINDFCKFSYNHKCEVGFTNIPYIEINSQFPLDYRTKEQILSAIEDSKSEEA